MAMSTRYKDNSFHLMDSYNKSKKLNTNFHQKRKSQIQLNGKQGDTWDAKHMTKFLNKSNYSNFSSPKISKDQTSTQNYDHKRSNSSCDHFFKTTKQNKNASLIGYTKINPLVTSSQVDGLGQKKISQILSKPSAERYIPEKKKMCQQGKFLFQGNSVKFRKTDPLTLNHTQIKNPSGFQKQRLLRLIHKRHPHGITGIDHPDNQQVKFYQKQKNNIRIRKQPNTHNSFMLDRQWKSKGRVNDSYKQQYGFPHGNWILQRKFRNVSTHGYNILTNREIE